jgi:hypothetical protein
MRFHGLSVGKAGAGAKNGIFEQRCKVEQICKVVSTKDWCYGIPTLIDVRDDPSVNICVLVWTRIGVVVVEIWGEIPLLRGKWCRSHWGEWYGVPGGCRIVWQL